MKTTTVISRCRSGARGGSRRPVRHAHTRLSDGLYGGAKAHGASYTELPALPVQPASSCAARPRVLHIDADPEAATSLARLLAPDADVIHAATLAQARHLVANGVFSLLVVDPALPDGDARALLPLPAATPVLVYAAYQPEWRGAAPEFLSKQATSARHLWSAISVLLGVSSGISAGA